MQNTIPIQLGIDAEGGENVVGWLASRKLDGCRALWDGETLWTRNGNRIDVPGYLLDLMPKGIVLDGEIGFGYHTLHRTISAIRYCKSDDHRWIGIMFRAFGAPISGTSFGGEMATIGHIASTGIPIVTSWGDCLDPFALLKHTVVSGWGSVVEMAAAEIRDGGEGVVLRNPEHICHHAGDKAAARSADFLKVKRELLQYGFGVIP